MRSIVLTLRAELRHTWRAWLVLTLLLGTMGGAVLAAAAGARRTDTAYPRLLTWSHASDLQLFVPNTGMRGYYRALGGLPQVAAVATAEDLDLAVPVRGGFVPAAQTEVLASPDGRLGAGVDRVKILAGHPANPADPRAIVLNQKLADQEHARPGSTVRLFGVPNGPGGRQELRRAFPLTFRVAAIVVTDSQIAPAVTGDRSWALLTPAFLRSPVARRIPNSGIAATVRLRPGASVAAFLRAASALAARYPSTGRQVAGLTVADQVAAIGRAIRPYAVALALFAAVTAVLALTIIGQLLSRQLVLDTTSFGVLSALGMTRRWLAMLSLARTALVTMAGGILAVVIAIAVSPLMPIGPARLAEPHPGVEVNLAILTAGLAFIVLAPLAAVVPAAWRTAGQPARGPHAPAWSSRLGSTLGRAASLPGSIGARMAFEPGHGRTAVPVRSALAAITVAVTAVTAAAVFGSSLVRLVDVPHRYGQNWTRQLDLAFGAGSRQLLAQIVSAQRGVTGYADGDYGEVTIQGRTVAAIGLTPVRGRGYLTLLAGHPPSGPGQIVLGARTLGSLHLRLGQTVRATANAYGVTSRVTHPMRIVGEAVFPSLGWRGTFTGTDLGNGAVVAPSLLSYPFPETGCTTTCYNFVLLRYRPGIRAGAAAARLIGAVTAHHCPPGSCSVAGDQRPADIQGYTGIRATPLILGALLALLGAAALAHVLVTGVRRRRRDLAILAAIGMRPAQLMRVVSWQAAALTVAALIVGIPLGLVAGRWSWALFAASVGVSPGAAVPALAVLAEAAVALLLAVVIAVVPGRAAGRVRPAASLRTE